MIRLGLARDIFSGVAIAVISNFLNKLVDWGFEELKKSKAPDSTGGEKRDAEG